MVHLDGGDHIDQGVQLGLALGLGQAGKIVAQNRFTGLRQLGRCLWRDQLGFGLGLGLAWCIFARGPIVVDHNGTHGERPDGGQTQLQ